MTGILVANLPCGAQIAISLVLTVAAKRMQKNNVLIRNLESVETLGSTSTICSDKTGTLTMNQMIVQHLWFNDIIYRTNDDCVGEEKIADSNDLTRKLLDNIACLCNNATFNDIGATDGDASESALIKYCNSIRDINDWRNANPKIAEIPFNSTNKFQVSVHIEEGTGKHIVLMKGAPEKIFDRCSKICSFDQENSKVEEIDIDENGRQKFMDAYENLGGRGERVLGFCYSYLDPEIYNDNYKYDPETENWQMDDLTFCGLISMIDPPRPGVPEAIRKVKKKIYFINFLNFLSSFFFKKYVYHKINH